MKYIRFKDNVQGMERSGGTPSYWKPNNLDDLHRIKEQLSNINMTEYKSFFHLTHKKDGANDIIPPISRRFIKGMNFLFSNNKLSYLLTYFDEDKQELKFLYELDKSQIADAIIKIEKTIDFFEIMKKRMNISEKELIISIFNDRDRHFWADNINEYKSNNFLNIFSLTSLKELISSAYKTFERLKLLPKVRGLDDEEQCIRFASIKYKDIAKRKLNALGIQVEEETRTSLICKTNDISEIEGIWSIQPVLMSHIKKDERDKGSYEKLTDKLKEKFKDDNTNSIDVGVIDGGLPNDSFIKELLSGYQDNMSLFNQSNPTGNHAEQVCSILLCANNLNGIADNLSTPKVHLFNVIEDNESHISYQRKIRKIVSQNTHIKLWNLSIVVPYIKESISISPLGVFLDQLQEEFDVQFVIASGNWSEDDDTENISAPSGSFIGFSVGSVNSKNEPASYSKNGYKKYVTAKPDVAIFGGDDGDEMSTIKNNFISKAQGTSFATPLVARKLAFLISEGMNTSEAISTLIAYANYYSTKNSIETTNYNGHGVLPIDSRELINLVENKAMVIMTLNLLKHYKSGYFGIKIPKNINQKYDFSYYLGQDVRAKFEQNETFEYVLDSVRTAFGKVYGIKQNKVQKWTNKITTNEDRDEAGKESFLRSYEGKFKSRDSFKKVTTQDSKDTFTIKGENWKLEQWGLRLMRNAVLPSYRKNELAMSICIIFESKHINNLFEQLKVLNTSIIENIHENVVENYIEFE